MLVWSRRANLDARSPTEAQGLLDVNAAATQSKDKEAWLNSSLDLCVHFGEQRQCYSVNCHWGCYKNHDSLVTLPLCDHKVLLEWRLNTHSHCFTKLYFPNVSHLAITFPSKIMIIKNNLAHLLCLFSRKKILQKD